MTVHHATRHVGSSVLMTVDARRDQSLAGNVTRSEELATENREPGSAPRASGSRAQTTAIAGCSPPAKQRSPCISHGIGRTGSGAAAFAYNCLKAPLLGHAQQRQAVVEAVGQRHWPGKLEAPLSPRDNS